MPSLRQAFGAGGNHFSFATPLAKKSHGHGGQGGGVEQGTWIRRVRGSDGYSSGPDDLNSGPRPCGDAGNRTGLSLDGGVPKPEDNHQLGASPPVLWERGRPAALLVPVYPISSQAPSMAKYRQEMMELVKGVPESAYELSLRDLVEIPRMVKAKEDEDVWKERGGAPEVVTGKEKKKVKKQILRSSSMDSGVFLLKMFFPQSLGWKSRSGAAGSGSKVSPKPVPPEGEKVRPEKNIDAQSPEGCGEMIGSGGRNNSSGRRRKKMGCSPFSIKGRIRR